MVCASNRSCTKASLSAGNCFPTRSVMLRHLPQSSILLTHQILESKAMFSAVGFLNHLRPQGWMGRCFIPLKETESTMEDARLLALKGVPNGAMVLADYQTAGRGRREGRSWDSAQGKNLMFTFVLGHDLVFKSVGGVFGLIRANVATTLAVARAVNHFLPSGFEARSKWPNDVWVGGHKICGVLADSDSVAGARYGVGINVNELFEIGGGESPATSSFFTPATSVAQVRGEEVSRELLLSKFCSAFEQFWEMEANELLDLYATTNVMQPGTGVVIKPKGYESDEGVGGVVQGINSDFTLKVLVAGEERDLSSDEVQVRIKE
eukprot:c16755_g1_i1.p1 GENE.c16755_g1_i1~~c16755_g1_i1.p1  ORF type:complete len:322 (+),score=66.09 c16755_g1_i1:688-1653(+)